MLKNRLKYSARGETESSVKGAEQMRGPSAFPIFVQVLFGALSLVPLLDEGSRMAYAVISLFVGGLNLGIAWVALRSRSPAKGA